jgi:hypothetical protein
MSAVLDDVAQQAVSTTDANAPVAPEPANAPAPGTEEAEIARLEAEQAAIDNANLKALETGQTGTDSTKAPTEEAAAPAKPVVVGDSKDRAIIALRKQNQHLTAQAHEAIGAVRVLEHMVKNGVTAQPDNGEPAVKPKSALEVVDESLIALAQDLEDGKIDMPAYKRRELELMDERYSLKHVPQQAVQQDAVVSDTVFQDHIEKLVKDHPYVASMTREQLEPYQERATRELLASGVRLTDNNRDKMTLQTRMAELVRKDQLQALGITEDPRKQGGAQPAGNGPGELSPNAQAREAKLTLAGQHPADVSKIGASHTGSSVNEAQALATLQSFGGDEDAAIRWLDAHPELRK